MLNRPLTANETAENPTYTHVAIIRADDLTQATAAAAQTIKICDLQPGDSMAPIKVHVRRSFQNTADAAFNTSTASFGDNAAVTTHLAAAETNTNGTVVVWRLGATRVLYTAADTFNVTFNAMAAKSLVNINRGEMLVYYTLDRVKNVSDAIASAQFAKT